MGRPSLYSQEIVEAIVSRLETGEPMAQICRDDGMPAARTVRDWIEQKPDVSAAIARAREIGFDAIAAETLGIADDSRNDWMERLDKDEQPSGWQLNSENVQRSKLRIETRLKLLAKWDPKRYGEAMTLKGDKDNPLSTRTDEQIKAEYAALMAKGEAEP